MNRSCQWATGILLLVGYGIAGIAQATVIQRDIDILLGPAQVRTMDDGLGNTGNAWTSPILPVAPFILGAGDQVITRVRFSGNQFLQIRDTGNGFFQGGNGPHSHIEDALKSQDAQSKRTHSIDMVSSPRKRR